MSIRFAPATGSVHHLSAVLMTPRRVRGLRMRGANDDAAGRAVAFDPLLVDALRHFARHGLAAAPAAHRAANAALAAGEPAAFDRWIAITRCFDARLARGAEAAARREDG